MLGNAWSNAKGASDFSTYGVRIMTSFNQLDTDRSLNVCGSGQIGQVLL
jgi:hypothetical protein